ncbi:MAG: hypothetical protein M1827_004407 [Pycnora praestabilis]|nr:MAG: hypothetical protein M1827_004407 [Pycnora praestabilis]
MASGGEAIYFPPLDKCLSGEHLLISWKTVFNGLLEPEVPPSGSALEQHINNQFTIAILNRPFDPYPTATSQTKSSFETRTAAINVTPSAHGQYDINQIKEDSLWLSQQARISEVSALRIVVLEWQTRPAAQLLNGFSEEEVNSVLDAAGSASLGSSVFLPRSSILPLPGAAQAAASIGPDLPTGRRLRLLNLYLSERRYLLKVSELFVSAGLYEEASNQEPQGSGKRKEKKVSTWVQDIGTLICHWYTSGGDPGTGSSRYLCDCITALQRSVDALEKGSGWLDEEGGRAEFEDSWGKNQIVEMIHIMQLMFFVLDSSRVITSSAVVLAWFRFMITYSFFNSFEPPSSNQHELVIPLQSMVAVVSLALLKLPHAISHLLNPSDPPSSTLALPDTAPYILNTTTISEMNVMLIDAAIACTGTASLAVFAWGIILQTLREVALARKEARELRQSQRAADGFTTMDSSETEGGDSSATENGARRPQHRRHSNGSETSLDASLYEDVLESIMDTTLDEDPIAFLAKSAVNGSRVFQLLASLSTDFCTPFGSEGNGELSLKVRLTLLKLVRFSLEWVDYLPEVVLAALMVLAGGERYWEFVDHRKTPVSIDPIVIFLSDGLLVQKLLQTALSRFPYETLPFLKFCRALAACDVADEDGTLYIVQTLQDMGTFTQVLPQGFSGYDAVREDENANYVSLRQDLPIFFEKKGRHSMLPGRSQPGALILAGDKNAVEGLYIPEGSEGRVISDSRPLVIIWNHQYSALKYLGRLLESALSSSDSMAFTPSAEVDRTVTTEIIGLLTMLLTSIMKAANADIGFSQASDAAQRLLEEASYGLERNGDIVSIVFGILEEELQKQQRQSETEASLDLLVNCIQFIHALVSISPARVWPLLARSSLLEIDGKGGKLAAVIAGTEIVSGHYDFLIGCIRLFEILVEDAIVHSVARKASSKAVTRFIYPNGLGSGVPEKIVKNVLLAFERTMVDVFESSPNWRFAILEERLEINMRITNTFNKILCYSYGIDDNSKANEKILGILTPAAEYLIDVFLSTSSNDLPLHPIFRILCDGVATPNTTLHLRLLHFWTAQVHAILRFSTTLIRICGLNGSSTSHFETQLFKASPLLARLYVTHESFRSPIVSLFEALVISAGSVEEEPPSLLGHLGQSTARNFLIVLSNLGKPLDDDELDIAIWALLSAVVSNRQQWFAVYLLTGNTPRDSLKKDKESDRNDGTTSTRGKPLLSVALDSLADIQTLDPRRAVAMLEFVSLAKNFWPWAMPDLRETFLTALVNFVGQLGPTIGQSDLSKTVETCNKINIASLIAEILAMYIHQCRQMGDTSFAKRLIPSLNYFTNNAITVPGYNSSLHGNLRKNFEMKFPQCILYNFKRTQLQQRHYGRDYYYDMEISGKMLEFDQAWAGNRNQGFSEEFARANVNFSVVEAQILLLRSWKFLAIEMSSIMSQEVSLQKSMARIVKDCLISNAETNLPEIIFERLVQVRADFAFVLMQRLVKVRSDEPEVRSILRTAWSTIRTSGTAFELDLVGGDAEYNRSLLKILFLAMQPHLDLPKTSTASTSTPPDQHKLQSSSETTQIVLEVLTVVIAHGFRAFATHLHDNPQKSSPSDLALITAILQTCLRIRGTDTIQSQIVTQLTSNQTVRYATTLFSWSDQLTIANNDPIYGELSILFLLELSSMALMAEQLAVEGILAQLSTAKILNHYRRPNGIGPFDDQPRLHAIWVRGILPLCLNLLDAVGAPMAGEIAGFLNQFPNQLARAANAFGTKASPSESDTSSTGSIALSMASEAHTLSLISLILSTFRAAGASAGVVAADIAELVYDRAQVKEDIEGWLQARNALRERIVPINEREVQLVRMKAEGVGSGAENRLEERVVKELGAALGCLGGGGGGGGRDRA